MPVILNLVAFVALMATLALVRGWSLSRRILSGLVLGLIFGLVLQLLYPVESDVMATTLDWVSAVGMVYISLLKMLIVPLVLVMMVASVLKMEAIGALGRIGGTIVLILIGTTVIAALVGIAMANLFELSAEGLTQGARELEQSDVLTARYEQFGELSLPQMLASMVPSNIFVDLSQDRPMSIIAVVIFGIMAGIAALVIAQNDADRGADIRKFVDTAQALVMQLVRMVMALTPFGILALITKVVASSDASDILGLLTFVLASYCAIAIMFAVHSLLIILSGRGAIDYFRKVWPVLVFAFSSRSSAATIPLSVEAQIDKLDVSPPIANLAASFGSTIGQNGCAGIYPAMLAVMIAPTMGIDPLSFSFIAGLVSIIAVGSFGIAGVGGGATMAAFIVLPAMGFPVTVAALLISIEPMIDMARTALNVNGAITAGVLTDRLLGSKAIDETATATG